MKKINRIFIIIIFFIFTTTFNPNKHSLSYINNSNFFSIKNIKIINNNLIHENEIKEQLNQLYYKNIFLIKVNDIKATLKKISFLKNIEVKKKIS